MNYDPIVRKVIFPYGRISNPCPDGAPAVHVVMAPSRAALYKQVGATGAYNPIIIVLQDSPQTLDSLIS
jgi:hypothetical protein